MLTPKNALLMLAAIGLLVLGLYINFTRKQKPKPNSEHFVELKWQQSPDITGINIYRTTYLTKFGETKDLLFTSNTPVTSYKDYAITPEATYYYRVCTTRNEIESCAGVMMVIIPKQFPPSLQGFYESSH